MTKKLLQNTKTHRTQSFYPCEEFAKQFKKVYSVIWILYCCR